MNISAAHEEPKRIVSLLASGTELVCALGVGDRLVGRSHECDSPEWVKTLPVVCRLAFEVDGSSRVIDTNVRERLSAGKPLYVVDEDLLSQLSPDVVITQTHCEVCAPSPADFAHARSRILDRHAVVALHTGTLEGIIRGFLDVARVLGRSEQGRQLVGAIRGRLDVLGARARGLPRPRVACLEWIDPVFAMGNWGPELVDIAGGENVLGTPGTHSTSIPWQRVLDANPDVLVVAPCGFGLRRALEEMPILASHAGWSSLRAVRHEKVFVADGNIYFNRSGPSVFDTPEVLAEMLHPDVFPPNHEDTVWTRWRRD